MDGTRLVKPGLDAKFAAIVDITWKTKDQRAPTVTSKFVRVADWPADVQVAQEAARAYEVLRPLRDSELSKVPACFRPLSSSDARGQTLLSFSHGL